MGCPSWGWEGCWSAWFCGLISTAHFNWGQRFASGRHCPWQDTPAPCGCLRIRRDSWAMRFRKPERRGQAGGYYGNARETRYQGTCDALRLHCDMLGTCDLLSCPSSKRWKSAVEGVSWIILCLLAVNDTGTIFS